jgi:DNA-binding transcriptional MerR regulator
MENSLPPIPAKRYFTFGEVGELCCVKPHVLRYWEQEFTQLRPMKRRGNRRYYQHHEVLMVRRIRGLLYEQGFTISGARNQMLETAGEDRQFKADDVPDDTGYVAPAALGGAAARGPESAQASRLFLSPSVRDELLQIRDLLAEVG